MNNIYQFIVGQTRYYLYCLYPKLIRLHIREQVGYRRSACSPVCLYEARCCGCKAPNVFFAPKGCSNGSYPKLMDKTSWEDYKKEYYIKFSELSGYLFGYTGNDNIFYINSRTDKQLEEMKVRIESIIFNEFEDDDLFIETN